MTEVTDLELAYRIGVTAVGVVGPTLLYLGLWRLLMWLKDDELIEGLVEQGALDDPRPAAVDVLPTTSTGVSGQRCSNCGTTNVPAAPVCRSCHRDL